LRYFWLNSPSQSASPDGVHIVYENFREPINHKTLFL
jgi:hypothetical protein